MSQDPARCPVVVGVGQVTERDPDPANTKDPVALMLEAAGLAAQDAGLRREALGELDQVIVPSVFGARYANAARLLAEGLGASAATPRYTAVGGNGPQKQINAAARAIEAGEADFVLVAGAEALESRRRARKAGIVYDWSGGGEPSEIAAEPPPASEAEVRHQLMLPIYVYPLYENALRAALGRDVETHRRALGRLMARASDVAADNPHAWFRTRRSAEEITVPGTSNRMVAFPYTKYMNAMLVVDQSAALLLTSAERARALGVPADRLVHWLGGGDANETPWHLAERPELDASNGMARVFGDAFAEARLAVEDVHAFDLYSCFPSAVQLACRALGIESDDPRPLTVTGGLAYAGGPGNNYVTHSVAAMVKRLRADPGAIGMTTGVGWFFTKHSAGLYSTLPRMELPSQPAAPAEAVGPVEVAAVPEGRGRIEAYTVAHDREGAPERGIAVGRLEDERRFLAFVEGGEDVLAALEAEEGVGRTGTVRTDGETGWIALD